MISNTHVGQHLAPRSIIANFRNHRIKQSCGIRPSLPPRLNRASASPVFIYPSNAQHHKEGSFRGI